MADHFWKSVPAAFKKPTVSQVPGKYLCFLVRRTNERNVIDPQHVMLALTRLRYFLAERGIEEFSMSVYDEYFHYRTGVN